MTLRVSDNRRFLVQTDGSPFFWLGDTAWELFHRTTREEAELYLTTRARQGFNVIQAVVLAEVDGLRVPNAYGDLAFEARDVTRPNERYFEHVDWIVARANALGLWVTMLPCWGVYVGPHLSGPREFEGTVHRNNAEHYGRYLGQRYGSQRIIWMLGGDRPSHGYEPVWRALAAGLKAGETQANPRHGPALMTYHSNYASSDTLHDEPWLDFNTFQSGHSLSVSRCARMMRADYARTPVKPVLDAEPCYEDHPIGFRVANGRFDAFDVRRAAYWSVFCGGCGYTYGASAVWQMSGDRYEPKHTSQSDLTWQQSLTLPGAGQMRHLKELMLSRPYLSRIAPAPAQPPIDPADQHPDTRDGSLQGGDATYLMRYLPTPNHFTALDTTVLGSSQLTGWWYDVRTGEATRIGEPGSVPRRPDWTIPPPPPSGRDWVLVIDDANADYPPPGRVEAQGG